MFKFFAIALIAISPTLANAETADLKIRFEFDEAVPDRTPIKVDKDVAFCGKHDLMEENLVVNPDNKGIKDVILYIHTGRGGMKLDEMEPAGNTHVLANVDCRFEPHIVVAQVGDTLQITNPDPIPHNANLQFFNNDSKNVTIPPGGKVDVDLVKDEPAPIPVDCNIHPWMKSKLLVLDHPFAATSDADGTLEITGLPAGEELTFRIFHEELKIKELDAKDSDELMKVSRGRIEMTLQAGSNDMGTWVLK